MIRKTLRGPSRYLIIAAAAIALVVLQVSLAAAAAPANDDFTGATPVTTLPFTDSISTSDATAAVDDPALSCALAPVGGHTVWYSFTAPANMSILANTLGSDFDYDTTLSVYTGSSPGSLTEIACNDDVGFGLLQSQVTFAATAGETYHFMVGSFDDTPGGNLTFFVEEAPPPLEVSVSIDPVDRVAPRTGLVTLQGTVTCSGPASVALYVTLQQRVGRFIILGFLPEPIYVDCSGETPWSATLSGANGRFGPGRAQATVDAFAQDPVYGNFVTAHTSAPVRLRGGR